MSDSLEFRNTTRFIPGTIGEPGQRVFFLQIGDETATITLKLEKQQVRALAQFLRTVLDDLPSPTRQPGTNEFQPPGAAEADWVVGQIAVGVDEADSKVVLVIDELVPDRDGEDEFEIELQEQFGWDESGGSQVRAHVSVDLAATFIVSSEELMAAGRPPCSLCGQPLDPEGHACPRLN